LPPWLAVVTQRSRNAPEYASRLVEKGVPLAQVRDLLGHASITTTERYHNQKLENLQAAAAQPSFCQEFDREASDGRSEWLLADRP
jgi:hypothetical protein